MLTGNTKKMIHIGSSDVWNIYGGLTELYFQNDIPAFRLMYLGSILRNLNFIELFETLCLNENINLLRLSKAPYLKKYL